MNSSFSLVQFLEVLERYNLSIWPMQIIAYILGISVVLFAFKKTKFSDRLIAVILSFFWLWNGIVFCFIYWSPTYKMAHYFGVVFLIQGILFLLMVIKPKLSFGFSKDIYSNIGLVFILYAMAGYPIVGFFLNHTYPRSFPFGLVPCPLTIFTFGVFLLASKKFPKFLLIIPFLWGIAGVMPISRGIYEDCGLVISGILGTVLIFIRDKKKKK